MLLVVGIYIALVAAITAAMLVLAYVISPRHAERTTREPYQGGIAQTSAAHRRISILFYLVAALFVIFDIEVVFLLAWAVAARELGWAGFAEVAVFSGVLLLALFYLWRVGALDWYPVRKPEPERRLA